MGPKFYMAWFRTHFSEFVFSFEGKGFFKLADKKSKINLNDSVSSSSSIISGATYMQSLRKPQISYLSVNFLKIGKMIFYTCSLLKCLLIVIKH